MGHFLPSTGLAPKYLAVHLTWLEKQIPSSLFFLLFLLIAKESLLLANGES